MKEYLICHIHTAGMTFQTRYGAYWNLTYRGAREVGGGKDNRLFIDAVFWIMRTEAPWRDLPPDLGGWSNTHRRFIRWRDQGIWEKLLEVLIDDPDYEWLMIDASHCKVHPHVAGGKGGNQDMDRTKGGSTPRYIWFWIHMVCRYTTEKKSRRITTLR